MTTSQNTTAIPTEAKLIRQAFGEVLAKRRADAGYKQRMFSRMVGISNSHLRSIEGGETSPTLVTMYKIAATLEAEPADLVYETSQLLQNRSLVPVEYVPRQK